MPSAQSAVHTIIKLLQGARSLDYIGEPVSQLEHALQAADAAQRAGADEPLIIAALLHDIGHWVQPEAPMMDGLGAIDHERIAADFLRESGVSNAVATLVERHVDAKRYLVTTRPEYRDKLSDASKATLEWQGGLMSQDEVLEFEGLDQFQNILRLRAWDEAAKRTNACLPDVDSYGAMLLRNLKAPLTDEALASWQNQGYVHLKAWYSDSEMQQIQDQTEALAALPETPGQWMQYFEQSGNSRLLCRIENFLQYNSVFDRLVNGAASLNLLSKLMGEEAILFKEKINFKYAGGQGFKPHQDAPAFTAFDQQFHITMMLSIDATTMANGCLEIGVPADGSRVETLLPMRDDLTLSPATVDSLNWFPIETSPGDLVLFDSYVPHRSAPNESDSARRALYVTYGPEAEGDFRERYFADKRIHFPPDCERVEGESYAPGIYNVGNPVSFR